MRKPRCIDPRHIGCHKIAVIRKRTLCQNCYQWLRNHGRLDLRPYIFQGDEPEELRNEQQAQQQGDRTDGPGA